MSGHDARDYAETSDELARDVLDPEEYREHVLDVAERIRLRSVARKHRDARMRAADPWADDYRGPAA